MAKSLKTNRTSDPLPIVIVKTPGEGLTQEDCDKLKESAAAIQPEKLPPNSMDDLDIEVSDKINEFYRWLCEKKVTFYIGAILPKSKEKKSVYRICELETPKDKANYDELMPRLGWLMYCFLDHARILHWIEKMGYITVHKSLFDKK